MSDTIEDWKAKYGGLLPKNLEEWKAKHGSKLQAAESYMAANPQGGPSELEQVSPTAAGFVEGLAGKAPDEVSGSVFDPGREDKKTGALAGFVGSTALQAAPVVGGALKFALPKLGDVADAYHTAIGGKSKFIQGTMAEGADAPEHMSARFKLRNERNPQQQYQMADSPETAWFKGGDNKWRLEVADPEAKETLSSKYDPEVLKRRHAEEKAKPKKDRKDVKVKTTLAEVFDSPKLYAAYPELKDYNVHIDPGMPRNYDAMHDEDARTISLSPELLKNPTELVKKLKHETQHAIDSIEVMQNGAPLNELVAASGSDKGWQQYHRAAGEAQARSQEARSDLTSEERVQRGFPLHMRDTGERYNSLTWGGAGDGASASAPIPMQEALGPDGTTLKTLERLPNRGMLPVQLIRDQMKRADVSKAEKDILEGILPQEGVVKAEDLANQFREKTKDFTLTPHHHGRYADYGLENIDRPTNSQWEDEVGVDEFDAEDAPDVAPIDRGARTTTWRVPEGVSGNTANHFQDPDYFAHTRAFEEDGIPHVVELQSDLMQKATKPMDPTARAEVQKNLDNVTAQLDILRENGHTLGPTSNVDFADTVSKLEKFNPDIKFKLGQKINDRADVLRMLNGDTSPPMDPFDATDHVLSSLHSPDEETRRGAANVLDSMLHGYGRDISVLKSEHEAKLASAGSTKDLTPLKKTHQERLVREELAMAARAGQAKVRFASPDTVAKVESWPEPAENARERIARNKKDLAYHESRDTDTSKRMVAHLKDIIANDEEILKNLGPARFKKEHQGIYDNYKEVEKYLKKIGGTEYTDKHGHTWIEVPTKGDKSPVLSGRTPLFTIAGGGATGYNANKPEAK